MCVWLCSRKPKEGKVTVRLLHNNAKTCSNYKYFFERLWDKNKSYIYELWYEPAIKITFAESEVKEKLEDILKFYRNLQFH